MAKQKKSNVDRHMWTETMYLVSVVAFAFGIFINILLICNPKWIENLADFISAILLCTLSIIIPICLIMYYGNTKYIFYADRVEKYNFFNIKKTYYYEYLEAKEFIKGKNKVRYFYYKGKRTFKFNKEHWGAYTLLGVLVNPHTNDFPSK